MACATWTVKPRCVAGIGVLVQMAAAGRPQDDHPAASRTRLDRTRAAESTVPSAFRRTPCGLPLYLSGRSDLLRVSPG
jgi:hypothetical protein